MHEGHDASSVPLVWIVPLLQALVSVNPIESMVVFLAVVLLVAHLL